MKRVCNFVVGAVAAFVGSTSHAQLAVNPNISGTGAGLSVVTEGTGLNNATRSGVITLNIGGPVQSAYLYWNGCGVRDLNNNGNFNDEQSLRFQAGAACTAAGAIFPGAEIGYEFANSDVMAYRADVTSVVQAAFAGAGSYSFAVCDPSFPDNLGPTGDPSTGRLHGAGLLVMYTNPSDSTVYQIIGMDGLDYAWAGFVSTIPAAAVTAPVTFSYAASAAARNAELRVFVGEGQPVRPDRLTVSGHPAFNNQFDSSDGAEWDSDSFNLNIGAGVVSTTAQLISPPEFGPISDSLDWVMVSLRIPVPQQGGGQGCTPGYWKQSQHFDSWPAPYAPNTKFSAVFDNAFGNKSLLQVLNLTGGGLNALGRHTVAALLNAASPGVNYGMTPAEVIAAFNAAYPGTPAAYETLKNQFDALNEQGCPLN